MKKSKIPTIIGILLLVAGLAAGVFLVRNNQLFRLGASQEGIPKDVRITNISDNSFSVSWVTQKAVIGFASWGDSPTGLSKTEVDEFEKVSYTHNLSIRGLTADKTYYLKINSGGAEYDNNGTAWQIKTGPALSSATQQITVSGSVLTPTGTGAENALVYLTVAGSSPLSTTTSKNGSWVMPISSARSQDLTSLVTIDEKSSLIEISINAGPEGVTAAQIYPQSAKPVPPITLGKTQDFRSLPISTTSDIPKASIGLPDEATPSSGFKVDENLTAESPKTVTLESVSEGETVSSTKPEFFGEGPAGTKISITVESDPVSADVTIPTSGDWKWTPPTGLTPGAHKITISWRDAGGILKTLTRTFTVYASGAPAFTATPSATPTVSATPTKTPTPTPTTTKTPTPTITSTVTPTQFATPESGSLTPTILLFIMGLGVIVFASLVWRKSEI
jgi:hypothetical protein